MSRRSLAKTAHVVRSWPFSSPRSRHLLHRCRIGRRSRRSNGSTRDMKRKYGTHAAIGATFRSGSAASNTSEPSRIGGLGPSSGNSGRSVSARARGRHMAHGAWSTVFILRPVQPSHSGHSIAHSHLTRRLPHPASLAPLPPAPQKSAETAARPPLAHQLTHAVHGMNISSAIRDIPRLQDAPIAPFLEPAFRRDPPIETCRARHEVSTRCRTVAGRISRAAFSYRSRNSRIGV